MVASIFKGGGGTSLIIEYVDIVLCVDASKPCETEADPSCEHYRCQTGSPTVTNLKRTFPLTLHHRFSRTISRAHMYRVVRLVSGKRLRRVTINVIGKSGSSILFCPPLVNYKISSCFTVILIQPDTCTTNVYIYRDTCNCLYKIN